MYTPLEIKVWANPGSATYGVYIAGRDGNRRQVATAELKFYTPDPGAYILPTLSLSPEEAQQLMDSLWAAGLRPNNGEGGIAQVEALTRHLDDMRTIAANQLGIVLD